MMKEKQQPSPPGLTADIVFGTCLIGGLFLQYLWPLSFDFPRGSIMLHIIGAPLLLLGGAIIVMAKRELQRLGQTSEHKIPTTRIITSGPYRYSRNPLYAGLAACFCGLGIAINMPWYLILLFPTLLFMQVFMIQREERYLEAKFGEEYLHYKKTVRRWL